MAITTIAEAITRGSISIYLAANDNSSGALYGGRRAAPTSPVTIAIVTDALSWANDGGAESAADLRQMANYLIWLTGTYGLEATVISGGSSGGTVIPIGGGCVRVGLEMP